MAGPTLESLLQECLREYEHSEDLLREQTAQRCLSKLAWNVARDGQLYYEVARWWDGQLWYAWVTKEQWIARHYVLGIWESGIHWHT